MIHDCQFYQNENTVFLKVHGCAWFPYAEHSGFLKILSAAGSRTSVTGVAAMLRSKNSMSIKLSYEKGITLVPDRNGYQCWNTLLAMDTYHLLCVAKDENILPENNDDHLWSMLRGDRYTTPLLKDWIPELRRELNEQKVIVPLEGFNHQAAVMHLASDSLDALVSAGVKEKRLRIPRRSA